MKKFINDVALVEDQMIQGMVKAYPGYLRKLDCGNVVVRANKKEGKVALDQQRIRRQRLACNRPCHLRPVETGQCHLGFYPVWRSVHPLPVYTWPGPGRPGDIQSPSLRGHHCGSGHNQPEKEERIPAAPEPGTSVFQGRTVGN